MVRRQVLTPSRRPGFASKQGACEHIADAMTPLTPAVTQRRRPDRERCSRLLKSQRPQFTPSAATPRGSTAATTSAGLRPIVVRVALRAGYAVRAEWRPVLAIKPAALSVFLAAHAAEPRHIPLGLAGKGAPRAQPRCRRVLGSRPRSEPFVRSTRRSPLRDRSYPAERRR
jgi:hypothetical protein